MALYDFLVAGLEADQVHEAEASTDAEARRQGFRFAGDLIKEREILSRESVVFEVRVKTKDGRQICAVNVRLG